MTTPEQQALLDDLISHLDDAATHVKALIAENLALKAELERVKAERDDWGKRWHQERRKVAELRYPGMTGVVKPMAEELEAIKQGAGEPVAWMVRRDDWPEDAMQPVKGREPPIWADTANPLYTRPCVPLTDEQIDELWRAPTYAEREHYEFARAIEAAHGIKGAKG